METESYSRRDLVADSTELSTMSDSDVIVIPEAGPGPSATGLKQQEIQTQQLETKSDTGNDQTSSSSRPVKRRSSAVQASTTDDHSNVRVSCEEPKRRKLQSQVGQSCHK